MITAPPDSCLLNPAACTTLGLTLQITMQFHKIEENTYILTSGGQTPDGVGIAILYRYGKFQFVLTTFNMSWFASVGREALPADWLCNFLLSRSLDTGIEIFVNNVLFGYSRTPAPHRPTSPAYAHTIFIGKQPSTSTGVSVDFTLKEFTFWNARIEVLVDKGIFRPPVRPVLVG
ncbi:hypothetical protein DPMN_066645 [Dreissena polymorpha]|uniref:Uncharacterized protein n=2 Tax=Dreissena polymorpha TaxID=45954 RepID=A0A9D3YXS2_DREPO|nr:hypothetical protein DPMN_066645 [Dreissena polymorpha]